MLAVSRGSICQLRSLPESHSMTQCEKREQSGFLQSALLLLTRVLVQSYLLCLLPPICAAALGLT